MSIISYGQDEYLRRSLSLRHRPYHAADYGIIRRTSVAFIIANGVIETVRTV